MPIHIAIVLFSFMAAIDVTVMATVLPRIIASLGDMQLYPLLAASYLASFFVATPIFGKVADHFGCKRSAQVAMAVFLVGSLCAGFAWSMTSLIGARLIQGIGAAGLMNVSNITIGRLYHDPAKRSLMQALLVSTVWAVASIVGPLFGAFITNLFSWRYIFFMNVPLIALSFMAMRSFHEKHEKIDERFDFKAIFLFVSGILLLLFATLKATAHTLSTDIEKYFVFGIAFFLLAAFIKRTLASSSPLIPLKLLKERDILGCIILGVISGACLTASSTLVSLYIQGALRQSMSQAGFVITATSLGWCAGSFGASCLFSKKGLRAVAFVAFIALIAGFSLLTQATLSTTLTFFIISNFILGIGMGSMVNLTITGVQQAAKARVLGRATSFLSLMRAGGSSLGSAVAGFLQLYFFKASLMTAELDGEITSLLISKPDKFLDKGFHETVSTPVFATLCELFAASIEQVFFIPVLMLIITLPLIFMFSASQDKA